MIRYNMVIRIISAHFVDNTSIVCYLEGQSKYVNLLNLHTRIYSESAIIYIHKPSHLS